MMIELSIKDFALISHLRLQPGPGLNVLTGETGAGKSIIIDAVQVLLGGRASVDYVRTGRKAAVIEAVFEISGLPWMAEKLAELGLDQDHDQLVLTREIQVNGRNVARVNGRLVTASVLRELGNLLVDIHGQHEHQSLLRPEEHIELLDHFGGRKLLALREQVSRLAAEVEQVDARMVALGGDERERNRRLDLLRYQVEEIDQAAFTVGEEEEMKRRREILSHAERLAQAADTSFSLLYGGENGQAVTDLLGSVLDHLGEAAGIDPSLAGFVDTLQNIQYEIEELARDLRVYRDAISFDPQELARVQERMDLLQDLKRKYGDSIKEILRYREEAAAEIESYEQGAEKLEELKEERARLRLEQGLACEQLSRARREAARQLEKGVAAGLADLGMKETRFKVAITRVPDPDGPEVEGEHVLADRKGVDRVEFLLAPNQGEPLKPLAKIASGGEMSRIMLALKGILAEVDRIPTLIFDEVDTGIGGRAARAVGVKLARIGTRRQILCVTHLAQIACLADQHYHIEKKVSRGRTETVVTHLDQEKRVDEIARMLSGTRSQITREHARQMLEGARAVRGKKKKTG